MNDIHEFNPLNSVQNLLQKNLDSAELLKKEQQQSIHKIGELTSLNTDKFQKLIASETSKIDELIERSRQKSTKFIFSHPGEFLESVERIRYRRNATLGISLLNSS